jgi:hypothetical protein
MAQDVSFWISIITLLLLVGVSVRLWFQNMLLKRVHYYLFDAHEHEQEEIAEFMEGFAYALDKFQADEQIESNAKDIAEWDAS